MSFKNGLLILSNPKKIGKVLSSIQKNVQNTLYIQLLSALTDSFGSFHPNILTSWPKYSPTIHGIYSQAATHCRNLDVRVLLSGIKYDINQIYTQRPIDILIFDKLYNKNEIDKFVKGCVTNVTKNYEVITIDCAPEADGEVVENKLDSVDKIFKHGVLGGTFDRLHVAHKLLLTETALRTDTKLTVGVTDESMIQSKVLWELIEDFQTRINNVIDFVTDICPEVKCEAVPISDPFGPSIVDPTMDFLVVSSETLNGGIKVNQVRESKNLSKLHLHTVELIDEPFKGPIEEKKISSSTERIRLLGSLYHPVGANSNIPSRPYVIGLTGGIASGKSGVSQWLELLGAKIIDCDKIGHGIYKSGKPAFYLLVQIFGNKILNEAGEIDRKKLGSIVFLDRSELEKLNNCVWPAMLEEINQIISQSKEEIAVVDAAVLLQANWETFCHEIWVTLVPKEEAIKRLQTRNNLSEEQALMRINSQPTNSEYVDKANVVFSTMWSKEVTQHQVKKAWDLLQDRIGNSHSADLRCNQIG